jgi:molecular chaperone GrpE
VTSADHQHENPEVPTGPPGAEGRADEAWTETPGAAPGEAPDDDTGTAAPETPGAEAARTAGEDMAGDTATELVTDLAKAQQDVAALTGDLQRLQAEYVNYKRRVDRDRELVKQNATFSVLSALLPVLDDIDRAREHGELDGGFKAVADSLERIVAAQGLEKFGRRGDAFDPNLHEALMHAHSAEVTTTTCQDIVQAGYRIGDRVVRAARVTVVDPEPGSEATSEGTAQSGSGATPEGAGDVPPGGAE